MTTEVIFPEGLIPEAIEGFTRSRIRKLAIQPEYDSVTRTLPMETDTVTGFKIKEEGVVIIDRLRSGTIFMLGDDHFDHGFIGIGERITLHNGVEVSNIKEV